MIFAIIAAVAGFLYSLTDYLLEYLPYAGYVMWFVYAFKKKSIYPKWYAIVLLIAVIAQLLCSAFFNLQIVLIGVFSRLEMNFFIIAAVTEYKSIKKNRGL